MNENMVSAETTEEKSLGVDEHADVDGGTASAEGGDGENEAVFADTPEKQEEAPEKQEGKTDGKNAENARRRREEARQRELKETREKAIIEALGGKNPYTGDPVKDSADIDEFLTMQQIEREGGDPLADYARYRKERVRKQEEEARQKAETKEWYRRDREAFKKKYPDVDLPALIADESFALYADGKVGRKPISEIYEGFLSIRQGEEKRAKGKAAQILANQKASPGALASASEGSEEYFTPEQVRGMSREEVHANYDKIVRSMRRWK